MANSALGHHGATLALKMQLKRSETNEGLRCHIAVISKCVCVNTKAPVSSLNVSNVPRSHLTSFTRN